MSQARDWINESGHRSWTSVEEHHSQTSETRTPFWDVKGMWGSPLKTHFAQIPKRWNKIEIWSIVSAMNVLRMYDIFNHYPWSQAKGLLRRTHLPLQNICLQAPFTNTQIYEHERQSQTLLHTHTLLPAWQSFLTMLNFALLNMPGALLRKTGELECPDF